MIAYKFLAAGARGRFSGASWPVPVGGERGAWLVAPGPLVPCVRGVHACRLEDLPYWLDDELWEIELDGAVEPQPTLLIAERGRLVRKVDAWGPSIQHAFATLCVARAQAAAARAQTSESAANAQRWADDARTQTELGQCATAAYVAAVVAHAASDLGPEAAFAAERRAQAELLAELLGLA